MALTTADVNKIAYLARLGIDETDIVSYTKALSGILQLVEQMNEADVEGVEPMAHPLEQIQTLRDDQVTESDQHELFQKQAPQVAENLYLVPKVIE